MDEANWGPALDRVLAYLSDERHIYAGGHGARRIAAQNDVKKIARAALSSSTPAACPDCERMREERDKDRRAFTKLFLETEKDREREKMLRIGGLYLLAADGIISIGRAGELADCTHEEMRAEARSALAQSEEQADGGADRVLPQSSGKEGS